MRDYDALPAGMTRAEQARDLGITRGALKKTLQRRRLASNA
jgi:hypothetical protein